MTEAELIRAVRAATPERSKHSWADRAGDLTARSIAMAEMRHSRRSVTLEVGYAMAFGDLSDWCNQPQWALNLVKDIRQEVSRS